MLDALQVVVTQAKATEQAIINSQNAIVAAIHATASGGGPQAQAAQAQMASGGSNPLAGYTISPPGHVPGSGAPSASQAPSQGGASTGYSVPPPPNSGPPSGGGGSGYGGGGGGYGGGPGPNYPGPGNPQHSSQGSPGLFGRIRDAMTGGGQSSTTPTGALSALRNSGLSGMLGLAADIYKGISSKTESAARYQGMEGGTTRIQGGEEWGRQQAFVGEEVLRHPLTGLTPQEAAQAFADVTSVGYRGNQRQQALDFMVNNKVNMGMDENESYRVIDTAVSNSQVKLSDLSKALHQVSDAAGAAGVNALLARQNFLNMFSGLTNAGAGQGATALAAAGASSLAQYGRSMQNIDTSVQFGQDFQFRAAAHAGMSVGAYQNLMRTNPAAAQGIVDSITSKGIDNAIGMQAVAWIKQQAGKYGGQAGVSKDPELLSQLADDYQNAFKPNLVRLQQVIQNTTGVQVQEGEVTKWVVGHVMGLNASGQIQAQPGAAASGSAVVVGPGGRMSAVGGGAANKDSIAELAAAGSGNTGQATSAAGGKPLNAAQQAYYDDLHRKGVPGGYREPVIEAMLGKVKDVNGTKVIVHTASGPRLVSMAEAVKYFPNEIAAGKVSFVGKDNQVTSFKDMVGVDGDSRNDSGDATRKNANSIGRAIGDNDPLLKAAMAAQSGSGTTASGKNADGSTAWTLDLSDSAKNLLRLLPPKSTTATDAAAGARPDPYGAVDQFKRGQG
jgi:hypothetical protein